MDNVINKTKDLIIAFEESALINNLDNYRSKIISNNELLTLINKYNTTTDDYEKISLKKEIYKYEDYKLFMKYYNELFYYILNINNRFKKYTNVRCYHESN